MNYKITTIIPIYNAEKSLEQAVNSILNQKGINNIYEDLEIILVDDCSTDNSKNIINKLAKNNSNIKPIFLKENTGSPSIPRNIGIDNATGKYLLFLDNDDMFVEDAFITLYNLMEKEEVDIICFNHYNLINNELFKFKDVENNQTYELLDFNERIFLRLTAHGNIYKTSFLRENNIKFPKTLYEDGVFALKCFINGSVIKFEYYGYIYINSSTSLSRKINLNIMKKFFAGCKLCDEILKENNLEKLENKFMIPVNVLFYFMFLKLNTSKKDKIELLKEFKAFNDTIPGEVVLYSKPMEILNKLVKKEKYSLAITLSNIMGLIYKNQKINDFLYKNYSNFEKVENNK